MAGYWERRAKLEYYVVVRDMLESLGPLGSLADIGCADTPVACWGDFEQRWTVDHHAWPALSGVTQIVGHWPDCATRLPLCDVVTCLQVLEHVSTPETFCMAMFAAARVAVIISVPWEWKTGLEPGHINDPVDSVKLKAWTLRKPTLQQIVGKPARAVMLYEV